MKTIIDSLEISELRKEALAKWREYKNAAKVTKDKSDIELRKIYNQIKQGRKIIDITKVIKKAGVRQNGEPVLAIAPITAKTIYAHYSFDGSVKYSTLQNKWANASSTIFLPVETFSPIRINKTLSAPVPPIPPRHRPEKVTDDLFILWEVDQWKLVPPTDPYLLKQITKNVFVVLAAWDLTEVEKLVMAGRLI
jgi:hypothetical protein